MTDADNKQVADLCKRHFEAFVDEIHATEFAEPNMMVRAMTVFVLNTTQIYIKSISKFSDKTPLQLYAAISDMIIEGL